METFFTLLLRCACIENLNAARTHCTFIKELSKRLKEDIAEAKERNFVAADHHSAVVEDQSLMQKEVIWNFLMAQGSNLVQMYIEALLRVPPKDVAEIFVDTLVSLCVTFRDNDVAYSWIENGLH